MNKCPLLLRFRIWDYQSVSLMFFILKLFFWTEEQEFNFNKKGLDVRYCGQTGHNIWYKFLYCCGLD